MQKELQMPRHCLTDEQWSLIADLFPAPRPMGRPPIDRRQVVNGIVWILRTGAPWRDLPEEFGKWSTVWDLFDAWSSDGLLDAILQRLRGSCVDAGLIDQEIWHVDGTIVRAARCAGGGGKKRIRGNRQTMPSAVPAAAFPRKSISSATTKGTRSASR
jgi:transposase